MTESGLGGGHSPFLHATGTTEAIATESATVLLLRLSKAYILPSRGLLRRLRSSKASGVESRSGDRLTLGRALSLLVS